MSEKITRPLKNLPEAAPAFIEPILSRRVDVLPEGDEWSYEVKWDGYRCVVIKDGERVSLISRHCKPLTSQFQKLADSFRELQAEQAVIDGEIVALDASGQPAFQLLQNYRSSRSPIVFYAFDLLNLESRVLLTLPLEERRNLLGSILADTPQAIRFSEELNAPPADLIEHITQFGLEGIVAKRKDSHYLPGKRGGTWVKFKINQEQEFVIGGFTKGFSPFESLLVGHVIDGRLIYCGKVKAGFVAKTRAAVFARVRSHITNQCPFTNLPQKRRGRWGDGLTEEDMNQCVWVEPVVTCRIAFTEWTDGGQLRHSSFGDLC